MKEKLINIYITKYINGALDFHGIKLIPEIVRVNNYSEQKNTSEIYWTIDNPNDLSWVGGTIKNFIVNSIYDFYTLSGIAGSWYDTYREIENKYANLSGFDSSDSYISKKLNSEIKKSIMKRSDISFDDWSFDYKILNYHIGFYHDDAVTIEADVKIFNSINPQTNEKIERDEIIEIFDKMDRNSYLLEFSDLILSPIVNLVWNDERLCDIDSMFIDANPTFFDEYGNRI